MMMRVDLVGWALLMIALAMSFSVLHKAAKDTDKKLRILGNIIGIVILVYLIYIAGFDKIINLIFEMKIKYFLMALLFFPLMFMFQTLKWRSLLKRQGFPDLGIIYLYKVHILLEQYRYVYMFLLFQKHHHLSV